MRLGQPSQMRVIPEPWYSRLLPSQSTGARGLRRVEPLGEPGMAWLYQGLLCTDDFSRRRGNVS